jgi:hypothetical protein
MLNVIAADEHQTPLSVDDSALYYRNSPLRFFVFAHFVAMQPVEHMHALSRREIGFDHNSGGGAKVPFSTFF